MFDAVGKKYDLTNTILSFGQDRYWRKRTRRRLGLKPGDLMLDLAAGTGVSTEEFATTGAYCIACDFSFGMLRVSIATCPWSAATALSCPSRTTPSTP